MANPKWIETKKELDYDNQGVAVPKKVTMELDRTSKKILGYELKDFSELVVKVIGLIGILTGLVVALVNYRQYEDSKEISRKKSESEERDFKQRQDEMGETRNNNEKNYLLERSKLDKTISNVISSITLQKQAEYDLKKSVLQFEEYSGTISAMNYLLKHEPIESKYNEVLDDLTNNKYSKIMLLNERAISDSVLYFSSLIQRYAWTARSVYITDSLSLCYHKLLNTANYNIAPFATFWNTLQSHLNQPYVFYFGNKQLEDNYDETRKILTRLSSMYDRILSDYNSGFIISDTTFIPYTFNTIHESTLKLDSNVWELRLYAFHLQWNIADMMNGSIEMLRNREGNRFEFR